MTVADQLVNTELKRRQGIVQSLMPIELAKVEGAIKVLKEEFSNRMKEEQKRLSSMRLGAFDLKNGLLEALKDERIGTAASLLEVLQKKLTFTKSIL